MVSITKHPTPTLGDDNNQVYKTKGSLQTETAPFLPLFVVHILQNPRTLLGTTSLGAILLAIYTKGRLWAETALLPAVTLGSLCRGCHH